MSWRWSWCANLCRACALWLCPSQWRGGLVYKGTDKRSFDDVTSFILRRHQINLCSSLLTIYGPSSSSSACSSPSTSSQKEVCFSTACKRTWLAPPSTAEKKKRNGLRCYIYSFDVTYHANAGFGFSGRKTWANYVFCCDTTTPLSQWNGYFIAFTGVTRVHLSIVFHNEPVTKSISTSCACFPATVDTIPAHLSKGKGDDTSSNNLAFAVWGFDCELWDKERYLPAYRMEALGQGLFHTFRALEWYWHFFFFLAELFISTNSKHIHLDLVIIRCEIWITQQARLS